MMVFFGGLRMAGIIIPIGSYFFVVLKQPSCRGEWILDPLYKVDESSVGACWNACKQVHCKQAPTEDGTFKKAKKSSQNLLKHLLPCVAWQIVLFFRKPQSKRGENKLSIFSTSDEACSRHPGHRRAVKCFHLKEVIDARQKHQKTRRSPRTRMQSRKTLLWNKLIEQSCT